MSTEVRRLTGEDVQAFSQLRREVTADNPVPMGLSLEEELSRPLEGFRSQLSSPYPDAVFGAFVDKGGGHSGHSHSGEGHYKAVGVERDSHGRIARSHVSIYKFRKDHPCPSTGATSGACPGYVIDQVQPLKRGGADKPANMQWQTIHDAKAKDRRE
jgi:hypothetical protein